jgi:Mrp family chromosome partitioning ATPase
MLEAENVNMDPEQPMDQTAKLPALGSALAARRPASQEKESVQGEAPTREEIEKRPAKQTPPLAKATRVQQPVAPKADLVNAQAVRERCRQICSTIFFREHSPAHSLGFTSAVGGEGKTLLALVTASVLSQDSSKPVTLLECNWERPSLHRHFGLPQEPGLAEWVRGECPEEAIRRRISPALTVIPAGNAHGSAMKLVHLMREQHLLARLQRSQEFLIVDLPAVVTSGYGALAASLVETLILVVHAGVTSEVLVSEACSQLKDLPVHGILLNQIESHIPRWIRQVL